jgi:hypothetical protein
MRRPFLSAVEECYRSKGVRVFRLNRTAIIDALRQRGVQLLQERSEVVAVHLFGSLARDQAVPGSDADLLIVLADSREPFLDRAPRYAAYFTGSGVGCDIFPYTLAEIAALTDRGHPFLKQALSESVALATRPG